MNKKKHLLTERHLSFLESLQWILHITSEMPFTRIGTIFDILAGKGYAALFIILSLPFCIPIQIPGFSTPFGLVLAFLALRFAFAKHLWWPKWILEKEISSHKVALVTLKTIQAFEFLKKISRPRLIFLTQSIVFHRMHGCIIFILSVLLLLPLPIPFTNMLTALPIFCIGTGLLEDDGIFILIGYFLTFICLVMFAGLILLGKSAIYLIGG